MASITENNTVKIRKFVYRWQLTVVFIIVMLSLVLVALFLQNINQRQDRQQYAIELAVYKQCEGLNDARQGTNTVLDVLIEAVTRTDTLKSSEKQARILLYSKAKTDLIECTPPRTSENNG